MVVATVAFVVGEPPRRALRRPRQPADRASTQATSSETGRAGRRRSPDWAARCSTRIRTPPAAGRWRARVDAAAPTAEAAAPKAPWTNSVGDPATRRARWGGERAGDEPLRRPPRASSSTSPRHLRRAPPTSGLRCPLTCASVYWTTVDEARSSPRLPSCIDRCDQRYGAGHVTGRPRRRTPPRIRSRRHDELTTYGLMKGTPRRRSARGSTSWWASGTWAWRRGTTPPCTSPRAASR